MEDINLSTDALPTLCRLCLKNDDFVVDIFQKLDTNSNAAPLSDKILDLYQIKVDKQKGLPDNICHRCLYLTESFSAFKQKVKLCQAQLQGHYETMKAKDCQLEADPIRPDNGDNRYEGLNGFRGFVPDENCEITVVDPNQEYESSDDCFSMEDSDNEYATNKCLNGLILRPEVVSNENLVKTESICQTLQQNVSDILCEQKNTFLCQYCDMAFTSQMGCDEHESRHDAANPFTCNFCPYRTVNRQVLIHHIKESHDNERPYVCALCNKGFCRRSDLKKHTIVHTGVRPFSCPVCSKSFSRNTNLTKHMRIHSGVKPHVCQKCPRSFITSADLLRHQRTHMDVKPHKCYKCEASFVRKDKLQKHYLTHLKKETDSISLERENQNCSTENIIVPLHPFVGMNQQGNVYQNHEKPRHPVVDTCSPKGSANFGNSLLAAQLQKPQAAMQMNRIEHKIVTKSNVKVQICHICSRTFTRKREFQRHQALHLDSLYKCQACGKNFNRKDKLFRHEELHHAEQYNCNQCNISFSKLEALQMHLKIHELNKSEPRSDDGSSYFGQMQKPISMGLGFYSEIKPEE